LVIELLCLNFGKLRRFLKQDVVNLMRPQWGSPFGPKWQRLLMPILVIFPMQTSRLCVKVSPSLAISLFWPQGNENKIFFMRRDYRCSPPLIYLRSNVFESMFTLPMKEAAENIVEMMDTEPNHVQSFLRLRLKGSR